VRFRLNANLPALADTKCTIIRRLDRARVALIQMTQTEMSVPPDRYLENTSDHEQQILPAPDVEAA
jgi:hypothetical protein